MLAHLLHVSLSGGVLILLICLLRGTMRRHIGSPRVHGLWLLVALRLLLPLQLPVLWEATEATPFAVVQAIPYQSPLALEEGSVPASSPAQGQPTAQGVPSPAPIPAPPVPWLLWLWATGAGLAAWRMACANRRFRKAWQAARQDVPPQVLRQARAFGFTCRVVVSGTIVTPCVTGVFRPTLLLPRKGLENPQALTYALAHEAQHLHSGDLVWALLRNLLCCLYWFHPLVWLAAHLHRMDAELACDQRVLRRASLSQRCAYAQVLLDQARRHPLLDPQALQTGVGFSAHGLARRVGCILEESKMKKCCNRLTLLTLCVVFLASFAIAEPAAQTPMPMTEAQAAEMQAQAGSLAEPLRLLKAKYQSYMEPDLFFQLEALRNHVLTLCPGADTGGLLAAAEACGRIEDVAALLDTDFVGITQDLPGRLQRADIERLADQALEASQLDLIRSPARAYLNEAPGYWRVEVGGSLSQRVYAPAVVLRFGPDGTLLSLESLISEAMEPVAGIVHAQQQVASNSAFAFMDAIAPEGKLMSGFLSSGAGVPLSGIPGDTMIPMWYMPVDQPAAGPGYGLLVGAETGRVYAYMPYDHPHDFSPSIDLDTLNLIREGWESR